MLLNMLKTYAHSKTGEFWYGHFATREEAAAEAFDAYDSKVIFTGQNVGWLAITDVEEHKRED